ncbi:MAG TPA: PfkB family carbohydrate kinase [Methylomirabilota bacterium]|nr:PfkB family carbohydrate kinase [Methylomirabilota bacterium]
MTPDFVAVGHLTLDRTPGGVRPGGAAFYAAVTAHRLGLRVGVLTSFGSDFSTGALPAGVEVVNVSADHTTIYELKPLSAGRQLTLHARGADIEASRLPEEWREAPLALLCPVANEVDPAFATAFRDASVGVSAQGWLRQRGSGGLISVQEWEDAGLVLPHVRLLVVSDEDVAGLEKSALEWFQQVPLAAFTEGRRGAQLFVNGERYRVEAEPAREVDAIGAGDVFAATLLIEYDRRNDPWEAAAAAACAAAAKVEAVGAAAIPDRDALEARLAAYRRRRGG